MNPIPKWLSGMFRGTHRAQALPGVSPSSPEAARYFGSSASAAGISVDERSAMTLSTYFACIRNIADDTSKCGIAIVRQVDDDRKKVMHKHWLAPLLTRQANPEMTAKVFRETMMAHCAGWGNGYAEIEWKANGQAAALWPLTPDRMDVRRVNGAVEYRYNGKTVDAANLLHVPGLGFDGRKGYSVARVARETLGGAMAADQFGASFFGNGARPSGALQAKGTVTDKAFARLRESFDAQQAGVHNAGRPMILEEGMEWKATSIPPEDAQYLGTRSFNILEVCRLFRMPPHKVAHLDKATFSNIEHQSIEYVMDCLLGWFIRFEQEIDRKLLIEPDLTARHNIMTLLRGDAKARFEAYAQGKQWGWLTTNQICRLEDMDPVGPEGDVLWAPVNVQNAKALLTIKPPDPPSGEPGKGTPPPKGEDKPSTPAPAAPAAPAGEAAARSMVVGFRPIWAQTFDAFRKLESDKAARAAARGDFGATAHRFLTTHRSHVVEKLKPQCRGAAIAIAAGVGIPNAAAEVAACRATETAADRYCGFLAGAPAEQWVNRPTAHDPDTLAGELADTLIAEMTCASET